MKKVRFGALTLLVSLPGFAHAVTTEALSRYLYEDTRQLVMLVEEAATLIEQKGEQAFDERILIPPPF